MNKAVKTLLIIAACCILGGIVITTACVGIARAQDISFSGQMWAWDHGERTYTNTGPQSRELNYVQSLELLLVGEPLTIRTSAEQDTVTLEWSQSYDNQYALTESASGHVMFRRDENNSAVNGIRLGPGGIRVDYSGWLNFLDGLLRWDLGWRDRGESYIDLGSSRTVTLTLPEGLELKSLSIGHVSGAVELDGVAAETIAYAGVDARFELRGARGGALVIANVSGNVILTDCDFGSVILATVSGRLELGGGRCERIEVGGVDAGLRVSGTAGLRSAEISGVNAEASLTLPGSRDDYDISAVGLNAELSVDGQYYGRRSLRGRPGAGTLQANGINAELNVRFEGE
ncbi:MAG: DUF4097 domain-containing protein [Oscillospiraceae bacterium]|nr:DUF4097 domain-containing protein [Oscillospiraceae bacterium]